MIRTNDRASLYLQENVSRETWEEMCLYHEALKKWNRSINLISPYTLKDIWLRHILDSYQIAFLLRGEFADLGSGAGLPGLICSIVTQYRSTLIESDERKCSFLRNVSRETKAPTEILNQRLEHVSKKFYQITSRALAPIHQILNLSQSLAMESTEYILLKGEKTPQEIDEALKFWDFEHQMIPSLTADRSYIVTLKSIRKKT